MQNVAFLITCKGRLQHVQQTLPLIIQQAPAQIILVDYACPDNTGDWVRENHPTVTVVRVTDDPGFCLPRARNIAAQHASTPWLCFIDADIRIQPGWLDWLGRHLAPGAFYRAAAQNGVRDDESYGTFLCARSDFERSGGYDEAFRGWGGEDDDLYLRLREDLGLREESYPLKFVEAISHDDAQRTAFHAIKSKEVQRFINDCYIRIKRYLLKELVGELPLGSRSELMEQLKQQLRSCQPEQLRTYSVRVKLQRLLSCRGQLEDFTLMLEKRRRFLFIGKRRVAVRLLSRRLSTLPQANTVD